jgi:hypothetical protein
MRSSGRHRKALGDEIPPKLHAPTNSINWVHRLRHGEDVNDVHDHAAVRARSRRGSRHMGDHPVGSPEPVADQCQMALFGNARSIPTPRALESV